jgi:hypothetical protein
MPAFKLAVVNEAALPDADVAADLQRSGLEPPA